MDINWGRLEEKEQPKGGWEGKHANDIPKVVGCAKWEHRNRERQNDEH